MKIPEVSKEISDGILESFKKNGFKFRKARNEFTRKLKNAEQIFHLIYYKENNGTINIKPEVVIHIDDIESIYKKISQIKYRPYLTLGNYFSQIKDYNGDAANFKNKATKYWLIENEHDISHLIEIIPKYLDEVILPYFENNSSIERVDELLNEYPKNMSVHNNMYPLRANIAIIAAKLNCNHRFNELLEIYEKELEDAEENYKIEFYKLKEFLSSEKFNEI
ncbi:hypothetical protein [Pedobacter agri]|uniref:hypothetical protein n=1 Tax=Pedobacter agri TaxID=454586 RepID=UPI00292CE1A4|nr:hypothetical protein [Pedobacter agri]